MSTHEDSWGDKAAQAILDKALAVLEPNDANLYVALEELPAPIYVTDADGVVVYYNTPCIEFSGRTPIIGHDRWCVSWKLYASDGSFIPHERCPMAEAIIRRAPIRGLMAIAERPDGTRVEFTPYPTPLYNRKGVFCGAVNILIDSSDERQACLLRAQADKCNRLSRGSSTPEVSATLASLAHEYEVKALTLESRSRHMQDALVSSDRF